ncbi:MAG: alpha/beta fold hydrolase [Phycisphaerales bacterium]
MSASSGAATTEITPQSVVLRGLAENEVVAKVVDVGEGRPIVFLHGLVGLNDHWDEVVQRSRHRARCVMLELPLLKLRGDDCSINGVEVLTERFLERLVNAGPPPVLVGNSFGGHVALRLALQRPDLVGALVLAGASGLIEKTMVASLQIRPTREWLRRKIGELFYDPVKNMREADLDRAHQELSERSGARAMVRLSRSARRNHLGSRIPQITAPTLLIWGKNDIVTPPEAAEQFMSLLPDARIVWFEHCGHAPMIEKPEEFAQAILAFVDELDRRERSR